MASRKHLTKLFPGRYEACSLVVWENYIPAFPHGIARLCQFLCGSPFCSPHAITPPSGLPSGRGRPVSSIGFAEPSIVSKADPIEKTKESPGEEANIPLFLYFAKRQMVF